MAAKKSSFALGVGEEKRKEVLTDPADIRKWIGQAASLCSPLVIWIKDHHFALRSSIHESTHPLKNLLVVIPEGVQPESLQNALEEANSDEVYLTIYFKDAAVLGVPTRLKLWKEGLFEFEVPNRLVKIERRSDRRFKIPSGYRVMAQFMPLADSQKTEGELVERRVFDLSQSGLSILVPEEEREIYQKGFKIPEISIRVRSHLIIVDGKVQNVVSQSQNKKEALRVGIRFLNLSEESQDFLTRYLVENLVQYMK